MFEHLTDTDIQVVLAFAENDMNASKTARKVFLNKSSVKYHLERVGAKTGLSPLKFYDLVKLVGILMVPEGWE